MYIYTLIESIKLNRLLRLESIDGGSCRDIRIDVNYDNGKCNDDGKCNDEIKFDYQ